MILYKYVDLDTAKTIMEKSTVKFSKPSSFNDPFELTSLFYDSVGPRNQHFLKYLAASDSYGILSLTRNPLNPLMWAHYAKGKKHSENKAIELDHDNNFHAGMVFGIDVELAGLNSYGRNVIPAKFGSVIYTSTKPRHAFENSEYHNLYEGSEYTFKPELLEALQRIFLYKSSHWSYEEEVRVVRNVCCEPFKQIIEIDRLSIKEVYIGFRNAYNSTYLREVNTEIKNAFPDCTPYVCRFDNSEWTFNRTLLDDAIK